MKKEPFSLVFYSMEKSEEGGERGCPRLPNKREKILHNSALDSEEVTRNQMGFGNILG